MKAITCCLVALLMTCVVGIAPALSEYPTTGTQTENKTVTGKVTSATSNSIMVTTDSGDRMTFMTDTQTERPVSLSPGTRIRVDYMTHPGGEYHASTVTTLSAEEYPRSTSTEEYPRSTTEPRTTSTDYETEGENLPQTASPLPLLATAGLAALGVALGLRFALRS